MNRFTAIFVISLLIAGMMAPTGTVANAILKSPYPTYSSMPSAHIIENYEGKCPKTPEAIHDMEYVSVYTNRENGLSIIDRKAQKQYRAQIANIKKYEKQLYSWNEEIFSGQAKNTKAVLCSALWLKKWAEENSLLNGEMTFQGEAVRKWTLAVLSSHYLQIKNLKEFPINHKIIIERWLNRIGTQVIKDYQKNPASKSRNNNHVYWAAWAVMITGVATNDRNFYDWGLEQYKKAIQNIEPDGTLPLETFREGKAFLYHSFAAAPLVLIAETATINGQDMYDYKNRSLTRLVELIVSDAQNNQALLTEKTGTRQDLEGALTSSHLAWLEVYNARHHNSQINNVIKDLRPMIQRRTGGNMTRLFASDVMFQGNDK